MSAAHDGYTALPTLRQVQELETRVARLEGLLAAEQTVPAAVAGGENTIERIAAAIERRAKDLDGSDDHTYICDQLFALAAEIRRSA